MPGVGCAVWIWDETVVWDTGPGTECTMVKVEVEVEVGVAVDCLDRAVGRSEETQLEERRDKVAWAGGVDGEEGKGDDELDVGSVCADGGEAAALIRGGRGMRTVTGDWEGMLGVWIGNLGGGGEGGLISASIKLLDCRIGEGDDFTKLA